ncbi:phage holin family protein [Georgenia thermotolerans]|uniref:Phage holin family protein n=1 Tax=Georgenia thermotolerans TaxID=527326 RepID=A0A7J5UKU5_9MICO|nr:phage holin family protein [Georgenia thermotolerans]KAE8762764.1 phage holin family protein [Georgenia thermotolerans]
MRFIVRFFVDAAAIWLCTLIVPGITLPHTGSTGAFVVNLAVVALVFTLVNTIVRPIVVLLSLPLYILTLGLFFIVVNALMLLLTSWLSEFTSYGIHVDGFWTAVIGGVIIAIATWILQLILPGKQR